MKNDQMIDILSGQFQGGEPRRIGRLAPRGRGLDFLPYKNTGTWKSVFLFFK